MKYSDKPISKISQDALDRADFAHALADSIDSLKVSSEGFVIALTGEWGYGKSSVIELIIRRLLHLEMIRQSKKAAISDQSLTNCSFDELESYSEYYDLLRPAISKLERLDKEVSNWERTNRITEFSRILGSKDNAAQADRYFRLKMAASAEPKIAIVRFSPWLVAGRAELATALLGDIARSAGHFFGPSIRDAFAALLQRLADIAPLASAGSSFAFGGVGGILSASGKVAGKFANSLTKGKTLDDLIMQLRDVLSEIGERRILIMIDDLDRLLPNEALEVVALVKTLGDLPNVVYFLSYDQSRLCTMLDSLLDNNASDYIAKIVQYSVALPMLPTTALSRMFDAEMEEVIGAPNPVTLARGQHAWHYVIRHYLLTPRDVKRLMNSYRMAGSAIRDVTDSIDLLVLETLRLFDPNMYNWIRRNLGDIT